MRALRNTWAVGKRELGAYFASPVAYVFIIIFLLLSGFFTLMVGGFFQRNEASLAAFFVWHPWLYLFLVPAIGMRLWSEERRSSSIELLLTMPITPWQAILGKYLAAWAVLGLALVLTCPIVVTVAWLAWPGHPDYGVILSGYIGSMLMAGVYLAFSSMTSAITRNQVISFILAVVLCLFLLLAGWPPVTNLLVQWAPAGLVEGVAACSVVPHFESLQKGVADLRGVIYFFSMILFALFTTGVILRSRVTR